MIEIAYKGVEQVAVKTICKIRKDSFFEINILKILEFFQNFRYLDRPCVWYLKRKNFCFFVCGVDQINSIDDFINQFTDIDQLQFPININLGSFIVCKLMAKCGDNRVIIWVTEGTKYIGDDQSGKVLVIVFSP